jgi:hypothetical protein
MFFIVLLTLREKALKKWSESAYARMEVTPEMVSANLAYSGERVIEVRRWSCLKAAFSRFLIIIFVI